MADIFDPRRERDWLPGLEAAERAHDEFKRSLGSIPAWPDFRHRRDWLGLTAAALAGACLAVGFSTWLRRGRADG